jgi:hypothetical protein
MYHDLTAAAERGRQPSGTTLAERGRPTQQVRRPAAARRFSLADGSEAQLSDQARAAGIGRLTTLVAAENHAGLRLLRRANAEFVRWAAGSAEFEIPLSAG